MERLTEVVVVVVVVVVGMMLGGGGGVVEAASWCVAKSNASAVELQTALDYACGAGADCVPIQSSGLCYLPNTIQSHASYAFNSYFQRKAGAPGACDFSRTAAIATTDPSYGSCVYPSSQSTAGGTTTSVTPTTATPVTPTYGGGAGGLTPGFGPTIPNTDNSNFAFQSSYTYFLSFVLLLALSVLFRPI